MPALSMTLLAAMLIGQAETTKPAASEEDKAAAAARLEYMKRSAAVYRVTLGDLARTEVKLVEEPVLRLVSVDLGARADIPDVAEVFDFARFLLADQDDQAWERTLADNTRRPRFEAFLRESAGEGDEPMDPARL